MIVVHGHDNKSSLNLIELDTTASIDGDIITFDSATGKYSNNQPSLVFGSEFQESSDDTESSTTSSTFQQKLRMTTGNLPSGKYRISWYYEWRKNDISNDFIGRVQVNDTITLMEHQQENQDANTDQRHSHSGFYYYTGSGVLNIDLDYRRNNRGTAFIWRARLEIWRVS